MTNKIFKMSLSEQIYLSLKKDIVLNKIKLGSRITIKDVQDMYEVSSTPAREALSRLASDGIVILETNKGVTIRDFSLKDALNIHELAQLLDTYALKYAMENGDRKALVDKLEEAINKQINIDIANDEALALSFYENYFHNVFFDFIDNEKIKIIKEINRNEFAIIVYKARSTRNEGISNNEHRQILNAIKINDLNLALEQMNNHFTNGRKRLLEFYNK
ncbi:MAG: GntR family transcriptional regulator [Bacilli bacterium]|jgi:DNA-binding GntR family transcriptional regulator|nr:GntR family transcriptional regulator [Bacilli bacterium]